MAGVARMELGGVIRIRGNHNRTMFLEWTDTDNMASWRHWDSLHWGMLEAVEGSV